LVERLTHQILLLEADKPDRDVSEDCQRLLKSVFARILQEYPHYFDVYLRVGFQAVAALVVAYSIFDWPVDRVTTFAVDGSSYRLEDLENNGVIFLRPLIPLLDFPLIIVHTISERAQLTMTSNDCASDGRANAHL